MLVTGAARLKSLLAALAVGLGLFGAMPARAADGACQAAPVHHRAGKLEAALEAWQSCLEQDSDSAQSKAEIHFAIGSIQLELSTIAYAIESLTSALQLNPGLAAAYLERARAHRRVGMKQESLEDSGLAFQHAKDDGLRAQALTHRGDDFARLNLFGRALADLDRALELANFAPAYLSRARVHRSMGRGDAALADLDSAIEADPGLKRAYRERAELRAIMGKHTGAVRDAEQAVRLDSSNAEAHAFRCRVLNSIALAGIGLESCLTAVRLDRQADKYQLENAFARWQVGDMAGMRTALGLQSASSVSAAGEELIESFPRLLAERLLSSLGYPLKEVDGIVDGDTRAAVARFGAEHGMPADPGLDEATIGHLKKVLHARIRNEGGSTNLTPPEPVLEVRSGPAKGRTITLWDLPMTLGRQGGQRARIESMAEGYTVAHVSGEPPPTLNGESLGEGAMAIENGDILGIFGVEITFRKH